MVVGGVGTMPTSPSGIVVGGVTPPAPPPKKRKVLPIVLAAVALLLLLAGGSVFAFVLPNLPDNVWQQGFNNSGKAFDTLVVRATDKNKLNLFQKIEATGSIDASATGTNFSGTFSSKYDPLHAVGDLSFTTKSGSKTQSLALKFLSDRAAGSTYPNIYFQLSGYKSLGLDVFMPGINDYDGKWIAVDAKYLESIAPTKTSTKKEDFTTDDSAELARAVSKSVKEYVLTGDAKKSIIQRERFVKKETSEDQPTYHFEAKLNKDNTKHFCEAIVNSVMSTKAYAKLPGVDTSNLDKSKADEIKSCQSDADRSKDNETFDVWINSNTKLVQKFRFYDTSDKGTYVDVGQTYTKGDEIPMFMTFHSDKSKYDGRLDLNINTKTNDVAGTLDFNSDNDKTTVKAKYEVKPYSGEIKVDRPAGAVPIQDVLKKLGIDPNALGPRTSL